MVMARRVGAAPSPALVVSLLLALSIVLPAVAAPLAAAPDAQLAPAPAPEPPAPPLEELVAAALVRSPALAARRAQLAAAGEREQPAAALPDPMVEASLQNVSLSRYTVGSNENSLLGFVVRQGLPYPGKRRARLAAARAETAVQAAELARAERATATAVRTLYARVYALDGALTSLTAAHELLDLLGATASARYSSGQGEQEALLKAQIEVSRLAERQAELGAQRAAAVAELNRLLDRPGVGALGRVAELPAIVVPAGSWEEQAVAGSPEVAAARAEVEAAARRLALARLDLRPDFDGGAGLGYRGGLPAVVTLSLGVELPLWRRRKQQPLVRAAEQELAAARYRVAESEAMARAAAARLAARWAAAEAQLLRFREAILPQTSAAIDAARASYLAGRGDFTTVIQDYGLWLEARTDLAGREAERFTAWAELEELAPHGAAGADRPAGARTPPPAPPFGDLP